MKQLIERAFALIIYGYDDSYIESVLWSKRDLETGIRHIKEAIETARTKGIFVNGYQIQYNPMWKPNLIVSHDEIGSAIASFDIIYLAKEYCNKG